MGSEKSGYDSFDSGAGPIIPEKSRGDFSHEDAPSGLDKDGGEGVEHGAIPTMPQKK